MISSSRDASQTPARKRGPPQVVDLTLSDDDDVPPVTRRPVANPAKRMRLDPMPTSAGRSPSTSSNGMSRSSLVSNGVGNGRSPVSSSVRESHSRSPPSSSISPRNDTSSTFQYNIQATPTPSSPFHPVDKGFPPPPVRQLPSPSLSRVPAIPADNSDHDNDSIRDESESPVLPVFSPVTARPASQNNDFTNLRLDWDSFRDMPGPQPRVWDSERDEIENEDLDLEMARLPSSMFDADGREDDSDDY
jgi:hypothetical protein